MKWQRMIWLAAALLAASALVAWSVPVPGANPGPQQKDDQAQGQQKDQEGQDKDKDDKEEPLTAGQQAEQAAMEAKACESLDTHYKTDTDKTKHPTPDPPADKALIYVVRPTMLGNKVQTKLAMDGKFQGINRGNNYFFFTADPGMHYFCSQSENKSTLSLQVEAGKTYYLQQKIKMGFFKARNKLVAISEEEGKKALAKTHPSSWEEKK